MSSSADTGSTFWTGSRIRLRALEPDPNRRWPTIEAFVNALEAAHAEDEPEPRSRTGTAVLMALVLLATFVASYLVATRLAG